MLEKLNELNNKFISKYSNNIELQEKYILIKKIISEKDCFKKINIETAYAILRDLEIREEELENYYLTILDNNS